MKKLFLASALLMASLTASAGVAIKSSTVCILIQEQDVYKKIKVTEIPKEVLDKIHKNYGDYEIKEAYKSDEGNYKLLLMKDGIGLTASFTKAGDLIKIYS
ncbi:hypothetical protein [Flavobacterium beibuense]|uniref:DUF2874 domain containing protein n=1 Tax=Flavobacterium beibuense TaxID=657326 RepID=A0A444WAC2_9FLAO|nr:hypothetical protein [Flavobacterium beibuense]RYJ42702.1 hypothetical protein NU09_1801 [Flavobacterium beibuense]